MRTNIKDIYGKDPAAPAESSPIVCGACGKPTLKPTTVLFGASLPEEFFSRVTEVALALGPNPRP